MGGRCIARGRIAALVALGISGAMPGGAIAQPSVPGGADGDPRPGPESTSAGSANGSAQAGTPATSPPPAGPVKDPKLARRWLLVGQQLMQRGSALAAANRTEEAKAQFENAVAAYQKALAAGDDVNVYLDLAGAEERLGRLDDAVKDLRRLAGIKQDARPEVARKAAGRLEELLTRVGLVTLKVAPAGASITLGGVELGMSPLPEPLVLMPGTYTLAFQAAGFQPREAQIKVEPGSEIERAITLEPVRMVVEPVKPAAVTEAQEDRRQRAALPIYVGAGVTVAGVLGTGIFGILAIKRHATFTAASTSAHDRADAQTSGRRFALLADVSLGTAAVAAGFTASWYFYKYRRALQKSEERRVSSLARTKLDVVPWVQPQSSGVMIAGWF